MTLADTLTRDVEAAAERLRTLAEPAVSRRPAPDTWAPKEILGHLVDSAANNHRRFVLAQGPGPHAFPFYEQDAWVARQRYADAPWPELVELWRLANRHLARTLAAVPAEAFAAEVRVGTNGPVTLGFIAEDYLDHLRHHRAQLGLCDRP
jgi:DinB superfamily